MSASSRARLSLDAIPALQGRRLILRPLTIADAPALFSIFSDPRVTLYWSSPPMEAVAEAEKMVEEIGEAFRAGTMIEWGVAESAESPVVGTCTLAHLDLAHRRAEIGYALHFDSWGRGLAAEAVTMALRFAFEVLDLHRIEADVDPQNVRSLGLLERFGFRREGYLRERWFQDGQPQDAIFFGLLRHEWRARDQAGQGPLQEVAGLGG